jgi:outer membrane protein assembly factor BamB
VFVTALATDAYGPLLYALDPATGAELWSRRLGGDAIAVPGYHAGGLWIRSFDDV